MCTLTWLPARSGGYDLFFNRDELDVRGPEIPPEMAMRDGARVAAPRDAERGGTWLALNEHGLTVALLNFYPERNHLGIPSVSKTRADADYISRGMLPWLGANATTVDALETRLRGESLERFRPFHLVAIDARGGNRWFRWDGSHVCGEGAPRFITSSSFQTASIEATRQERFTRLPEVSVETLAAFHRDHRTEYGPASICMRRIDGRTRSITTVHVHDHVRELVYQPVPWDDTPMCTCAVAL